MLELVCRELGSDDARLEIGGSPSSDPRVPWTALPNGFRLVAVFAEPPADIDAVRKRLTHLGEWFGDLDVRPPTARPAAEHAIARRRLDDELDALASRTGAASALVVDVTSPVIWGCSEARTDFADVEALLELAHMEAELGAKGVSLTLLANAPSEAERTRSGSGPELVRRSERLLERLRALPLRSRTARLLEARALATLRADSEGSEVSPPTLRLVHHGEGNGYFARGFASIYVLLLTFDAALSELLVEGATLHALPVIERHVLALPPVDPPPRGGRVVRLPRPPR